MAETFRPFAGDFSVVLLSLGLLCAVLSTMAMQVLVSGYVITDLFKWEADLTTTKFKVAEMVVTGAGLIGVLAGFNAFALASYGSGFNMTFFPLVAIMILIIANKKEAMGEDVLSQKLNIAVIIGIVLATISTIVWWINFLG
jgi:Mn2+/Fe2+ NRAMP family transporter